jgi:hypothetical protein
MMLKQNTFVGCLARAISRCLRSPLTLALLLSLASSFGLVATSYAQATATADKGSIDVVGAFTFTSTNINAFFPHKSTQDIGGTIGGDLRLRKFSFGQLAFAARYTNVTSSSADQTFIGGGLESHYRVGPVRPYATVLYGVGGLSLPHTPYSDSGNTVVVGGGVDVPINPKFAARGEFTYSFVNITGFNNTSVGAINISPATLNIGIVYHVR